MASLMGQLTRVDLARGMPCGDPEIIVFNGFDPKRATFKIGADGYCYKGIGSLSFIAHSLIDPWHELAVNKLLDAEYIGGPNYFTLGTGAIVKKY
jgi:hypothetical protein